MLNPTALKFSAPMVKVCTKASMPATMPAFALDLATTITIIRHMVPCIVAITAWLAVPGDRRSGS